jgi:Zn-finger nucleic acid-binding protein
LRATEFGTTVGEMTSSPPQAPYRIRSLVCPRCPGCELGTDLLARCRRCDGVWVPDEELHDRVAKMHAPALAHAPALLRWHPDLRSTLPCVVCAAPMETFSLYAVPVDRCRAHGVWFDVNELAAVLLRSREPVPPTSGDGTRAWGDDACDVSAVIEAVVYTPAVIETSVDVLEGVLDVLGAIFGAIDL